MVAKVQLSARILLFTLLVGIPCHSAQSNRPSSEQTNLVANEKLAKWMPAAQDFLEDATLAFLSDDSVVLSVCHPFTALDCPLLIVLQITDAGFLPIARRDSSTGPVSLYRTETGGTLVVPALSPSSEFFSGELAPMQQIPYKPAHISLSGNTSAASVRKDVWTIFRVCPSLNCIEKIRQVSGELEAVSDDAVAIRDHDTIQVETMQGGLAGSFRVRPKSKCATELQFAGPGRIFLESCGPDRMVDLHGEELAQFKPLGGWGFRHGWNATGTRVLYDHYIRTVPTLQSFGEIALAVLTLGVGVADEKDNGEAVRVVDTTTGKTCFDWKDPKHVANVGFYHADISPAGKLVALVTRGELFVYRLPDVCAAK